MNVCDCRDALESVTHLYNQVEEKLHVLVMRSNESLQQLELLFTLRDMDAKIKEVRRVLLASCGETSAILLVRRFLCRALQSAVWFSQEGERRLKDFDQKDNLYTEDMMQQFDTFLLQAKVQMSFTSKLKWTQPGHPVSV